MYSSATLVVATGTLNEPYTYLNHCKETVQCRRHCDSNLLSLLFFVSSYSCSVRGLKINDQHLDNLWQCSRYVPQTTAAKRNDREAYLHVVGLRHGEALPSDAA
jgi:hypothetical protein